jgi:hypothetical protein
MRDADISYSSFVSAIGLLLELLQCVDPLLRSRMAG